MMIKLLAAFGVAIATFGVAHADFSGVVVRVSDGDTIKVIDRCANVRTVRLLGIDAPEKKQAYGLGSRAALAGLVTGKRVKVISSKRDGYGRELGKVMLGRRDVNYLQVRDGNAWHYTHFERDQPPNDRAAYRAAEGVARDSKVGLWKGEIVPPWEWRRR